MPRREELSGDNGSTFVELLVSIVLLGMAVVATLVALQASVTASRIDADHARAFAWLQAASDKVFEEQRVSCTKTSVSPTSAASSASDWSTNKGTGVAGDPEIAGTVWYEYKDAVASAPAPAGWSGGTIEVTAIEFLGKPNPAATFFEWGAGYCFEGVQPDANGDGAPEDYRTSPLLSQKVSLRVTSPNGRIVKTFETVKSDR